MLAGTRHNYTDGDGSIWQRVRLPADSSGIRPHEGVGWSVELDHNTDTVYLTKTSPRNPLHIAASGVPPGTHKSLIWRVHIVCCARKRQLCAAC